MKYEIWWIHTMIITLYACKKPSSPYSLSHFLWVFGCHSLTFKPPKRCSLESVSRKPKETSAEHIGPCFQLGMDQNSVLYCKYVCYRMLGKMTAQFERWRSWACLHSCPFRLCLTWISLIRICVQCVPTHKIVRKNHLSTNQSLLSSPGPEAS